MMEDIAAFFAGRPWEEALFREVAGWILEKWPRTEVRVQKTQLSFREVRTFAAVWLPPRKGIKGRPERYLILTLVLDRALEGPEILEAYPLERGACANHILLTSLTDLEGPVLEWLEESRARSSRGKGRSYGISE